MIARGNTAAVLSQTYTPETGNMHNYFARQGIEKPAQDGKMIPLNPYTKYGRRLITENQAELLDRRKLSLQRLNSAPELHKPELPPILKQGQGKAALTERRHRPLTPLVVNSNRIRSTRSVPMNYRINLDLVPLLEVGTGVGNLSIGRRRQTSQSSSDSCFSSNTPSPRLKERPDSPEVFDDPLEIGCRSTGSQKRTNSMESLEEVDSDNDELDDGKDTMILRWLQTVEKSHETAPSAGELLPCIREGKLA